MYYVMFIGFNIKLKMFFVFLKKRKKERKKEGDGRKDEVSFALEFLIYILQAHAINMIDKWIDKWMNGWMDRLIERIN